MYLKSIEVQGFKSFANRLVFEFNKGITGIVGPNGSGKSNVADAVRWVLGEQSAKQLRGQKMEDVIFSGTQNRKPLGFAFVSITLDNSDHSLPVSYETVTVSRRVFRSGESEYKINGHSCRLKDIQEMFFDTGIGKEGYSIIGQGQIDKILSGKPEERRELFDEAAGIVKYKKRKAAALRDLDEEQQNIKRAQDIIHELELQLEPLRQQNEKAVEYLRLRGDLKIYEANMYLISFDRLKKEAASSDERLTIVEDQLAEARNQYESIKSAYTEIESLMEEYDEKISGLNESCTARSVDLQRLEGSRELLRSKSEGIKESLAADSSRISEAGAKISEKAAEIESCSQEVLSLQSDYEQAQSVENDSLEALDELRSRIAALREEMDSLSSDTIEYLNQISDEKSHLERYNTMLEQSELRYSQLSAQLISARSDASSDDSLADTLKAEEEQIAGELSENARLENENLKLSKKLSADTIAARNELSEKQKAFHEESARYRMLKNITERYEGYSGSIRRVMERKDSEKGLIGVVADVISVGKKYETAIETALGGSISNIITEDESTARRMIEYLKENRYGRATFLPLTSISGRKDSQSRDIRSEKGFIGTADELVDTDDKYRNITSYLLGRISIVDNIDHALAIARKYRYSLRIVTLEGESLNPGGSLSGGAYKKTGNLLARHREMDELKKSVDSLQNDIAGRSRILEDLESSSRKCSDTLNRLHAAKEELNIRRNTVQLKIRQVAQNQADHINTINGIQKELGQITSNKDEIRVLSSGINDKIASCEDDRKKAEERSAQISAQIEKLAAQEEELGRHSTDLRVRYSELKQKLEFAGENLARNRKEKELLEKELSDVTSRQNSTDHELVRLENDRKKLELEIESCRKDISRNSAALAEAKKERERYTSEHKSFFDRRESISETLSSLDREQVRLTAQKEKIDEKRSELSNHMWDEYKLTYVSAGDFCSEELQKQSVSQINKTISDTRNDIRELGDVNVNSIDQYKTVSERYQTMKTQLDDLIKARENLTDIIDSLNTSMRKQFSEKFGLINNEFGKVFSSLFGGGKGTLSLSDPDDLLETGVIITAQPPGKRLQNMMQLSGGEKALTAIALLFAIQRLKPSPFCLLDEIEAALDDSNVKRFAEYLHKLTNETQFIVITHRRGTMKAADVLYGITMQEKGVSTMVSVSLIENELSK